MVNQKLSCDADNVRGHPLRIAFVTETYPPEINGVSNTIHRLVECLNQRGHHIQLIRPRQASSATQVLNRIVPCTLLGYPYRVIVACALVSWQTARFTQHGSA
jgi:hypothetical protein